MDLQRIAQPAPSTTPTVKVIYSMDATVAAIETHLAWVCMGEILACCSMAGNMIRMHLTCTVPYWVGGSRCLASHSSNKALKVWKCDATILILGTTHTMFFVFLGFCLGASACQTWSFLSGQHAEMLSQLGLLPPSPSPNKRTSALMGSLNFVFSKNFTAVTWPTCQATYFCTHAHPDDQKHPYQTDEKPPMSAFLISWC